MKRTYLAITVGRKTAKSGTIDAPIGRDRHQSGRFRVSERGKQAITLYQTLHAARSGDSVISLLQCQLQTGRTHQIRVHLSANGAPILGDALYGGALRAPFLRPNDGMALHAHSVRFYHPYDETWMEITCPVPSKWTPLLNEYNWV